MALLFSVALIVLVSSIVTGRPQPQEPSTPIPIISQSESINPDGSFSYSFETGNGIKVDENGTFKPNPNAKPGDDNALIEVVNGSFSYTAPDGSQVNLQYLADENGFQPTGDHLPTPPPIPDEIQKALALLAQSPQSPSK